MVGTTRENGKMVSNTERVSMCYQTVVISLDIGKREKEFNGLVKRKWIARISFNESLFSRLFTNNF